MPELEEPMSIGELAEQAGLAASAIRYYERRGLLAAPERAGGQRRYGREALETLGAIALAKRAGFSLAEVEHLFRGFDASVTSSARWRQLAAAKLAELDRRAAEIEQMRELLRRGLRCGCITLDDCAMVRDQLGHSRSRDSKLHRLHATEG